jgi:peptidoglycan-associated lipoprotein
MTKRFLVPALFALATLAMGCGAKYPKCDTDENCHAGEYCVDGQCQECREDAHCGPGKACNAGRCEEITGYCTTDDACGVNERCERNRCVTQGPTIERAGPTDATPSCNLAPVYFEFDAAELDSNARNAISANVRCIKERAIQAVQLTGHTDPRGTEEYNLALSDRRALSVKRYMVSLGLAEDRIRSTGVGEEMAEGQDEAGYRRDRRVDFAER